MAKILISGGAGFIGSNFIRNFIKTHPAETVINYDLLTYAGNVRNLDGIKSEHYHFIKGDVADALAVRKAIRQADYVVHFAAESHVTRSEQEPERFYRSNVKGTEVMLREAKRAKIKKFIHISTDEVYGPIVKGYFKEEDKEPGYHQATSVYAKSKSQADDLAQSFFKKLPLIIVRPTNNFGPYQHPEKALPRWITNLLLGERAPVWGEGRQVRDWLFVGDTFEAINLLLKKGQTGEIYNIGTCRQREVNNREIAYMIAKIMGKSESEIELVPDPRPDHDFRYGLDCSKINALGWKPKRTLEEDLKETIKFYKNNPSWWKSLKKEAEKIYKS